MHDTEVQADVALGAARLAAAAQRLEQVRHKRGVDGFALVAHLEANYVRILSVTPVAEIEVGQDAKHIEAVDNASRLGALGELDEIMQKQHSLFVRHLLGAVAGCA